VLLDDDGRPYDAEVDPATGPDQVRYEELGELRVPGGHLRVMDGNALGVDPAFFADGAVPVEFGARERLQLGIIWEAPPGAKGTEARAKEAVLGVRIDVPGTTVARWGRFETAYGTDGGTGGITTQSVIDAARDGWDETRAYFDDGEQVVFQDWDGIPGADSLMFSNGWGDGGFPMARGFDREGTLVSLVVWDPRYPWRLAIADGTPPADVTEREDQLRACLDGRRGIDNYGRCAGE
jgi:hypothetical protein